MIRREFLRAGTALLVVAPLAPPRSRAAGVELIEYSLVAAPYAFAPGDGAQFAGLAYNGSIPGPLLRVTAGQRVRIRYRNRTGVSTSVHWHGMILPNAMDGVAGITQPAVPPGGEFVYEFTPGPAGTRWYHDHAFGLASARGLFGMFVVDAPDDEPVDKEFVLIFHDVPKWRSLLAASRGISDVPMSEPMRPGVAMSMAAGAMGDEVAYAAHCINGATYPNGKRLAVNVGDRVRLRVLNASPTQTRYVTLEQHELSVTHTDGNPMPQPVVVDALRIGIGERYDAVFEVRKPGAFLLHAIANDGSFGRQAAVVCTPGFERAQPAIARASLDGLRVLDYVVAGGTTAAHPLPADRRYELSLGGGGFGNPRWTIDGQTWPQTPKLPVKRGERIAVRFRNTSSMDHPMHLHGHIFDLVEVDGAYLLRPLQKDVSLIRANGGTATWAFDADASPGRWLLHCHNDVHMDGGMMTEVAYVG